jgi:uracil-DNA glycosylase family 4
MLKPIECSKCSLYKISNSFSRPDGKFRLPILIVGEGLGHEEAIDSLPFRPKAQAGSKLTQCIKLAGYDRSDFLFWNIIACQPPGNKLSGQWYEESAKNYCYATHFIKILNEYRPKVILALGNIAFQYLTKEESLSVLDVRGFSFPFRRARDGADKRDWNPIVVPGIHPSFIKRGNEELTPLLVEDIRKCVKLSKGEGMVKFVVPSKKVMENDDTPF